MRVLCEQLVVSKDCGRKLYSWSSCLVQELNQQKIDFIGKKIQNDLAVKRLHPIFATRLTNWDLERSSNG
jgi:hypothetical protein